MSDILEKLNEYAMLKQDITILEMKLDSLKPEILEFLATQDRPAKISPGTFSRVPREVKKYSEGLASKIDIMKKGLKFDIEKLERDRADEIERETVYDLRFTSRKDN